MSYLSQPVYRILLEQPEWIQVIVKKKSFNNQVQILLEQMEKQKISAKQTKPRCYNYNTELKGTFRTEKCNPTNF